MSTRKKRSLDLQEKLALKELQKRTSIQRKNINKVKERQIEKGSKTFRTHIKTVPLMDCGTCGEWGIKVEDNERIDVDPELMKKFVKLNRIQDELERNDTILSTLTFKEFDLYVKVFLNNVKIYYIIDAVHFYRVESEVVSIHEWFDLIDNERKYLRKNHILFITNEYTEVVERIALLRKRNFRFSNGVGYTKEHFIEKKYFDNVIMQVFQDEVMYYEEDLYKNDYVEI